jgi:hypothetical protein
MMIKQRQLVAYLHRLQAQVSALQAVQAETEKELRRRRTLTLSPSIASGILSMLDRAFKGEL